MEENFQYRFYPAEKLMIESIDSKLSTEEKKARRFLMNYTIDNGRPFNLGEMTEDIAKGIGFSKDEMTVLFGNLLNKAAIVVDEEKNVTFMYPVSALPTNHRITLADGRSFCAMCAIDGMGTAFTFKQDVTIDSKCSNCGNPIHVEIKNGELVNFTPEDMHILHVDLNKNQNWSGNC